MRTFSIDYKAKCPRCNSIINYSSIYYSDNNEEDLKMIDRNELLEEVNYGNNHDCPFCNSHCNVKILYITTYNYLYNYMQAPSVGRIEFLFDKTKIDNLAFRGDVQNMTYEDLYNAFTMIFAEIHKKNEIKMFPQESRIDGSMNFQFIFYEHPPYLEMLNSHIFGYSYDEALTDVRNGRKPVMKQLPLMV